MDAGGRGIPLLEELLCQLFSLISILHLFHVLFLLIRAHVFLPEHIQLPLDVLLDLSQFLSWIGLIVFHYAGFSLIWC